LVLFEEWRIWQDLVWCTEIWPPETSFWTAIMSSLEFQISDSPELLATTVKVKPTPQVRYFLSGDSGVKDLTLFLFLVGPIRWMSPENIARQEYSEKSDVWSFGVILCV
jgi:serine/threonine protein kinase